MIGSVAALALAASILGSTPAQAAATAVPAPNNAALELQRAYDKYSSNYDDLDGGAAAEALGFPQLRQQLLQQAGGEVLEVAVGTGLNLPYYRWAPAAESPSDQGGGVTSLATVDLSPGMLAQAKHRVEATGSLASRPISFTQADVSSLPFPDAAFDSVVDTFSLCVFPDPQAALNEMARVVRPASSGGKVLLLEHSRSDNPVLAAYQDLTAGPVAALGKGCVWNQDVEGMVQRAGLRVEAAERSAAGTVELIVAVKR